MPDKTLAELFTAYETAMKNADSLYVGYRELRVSEKAVHAAQRIARLRRTELLERLAHADRYFQNIEDFRTAERNVL